MSIFDSLLHHVSSIIRTPYVACGSLKCLSLHPMVFKNNNPCVYLAGVVFLMSWAFPSFSYAAVIINEVAWMGTEVSANDEWIEFYNAGSDAVSVDGWVLTDGANLDIELTGTVVAGQYAVLERTDDSSTPARAFMVYTGALSNTGATLTLKRPDGAIEDQVAGGENWENIGGDNTTKETAQYTTSGWVTGSPTPGMQNISYVSATEDTTSARTHEDTDKESKTVTSGKKANKTVTLVLPDWELTLEMTAPEIAYVHQPVLFDIEPSGLSKTLLNSVQYVWNFGDLTTSKRKQVAHQYDYPGTYVVVVEGAFKRHKETIRHEITVLPVSFSLSKNNEGDLQVHNNAKYEVDLSGYSIRGLKTVLFPEGTIMLPNATLTIPQEKIGRTSQVWLTDQKHVVVAETMPQSRLAKTSSEQGVVEARKPVAFAPPQPPIVPASAVSTHKNFTFARDATTSEILNPADFVYEPPEEKKKGIMKNEALVNQAQIPIPKEKLPYLGLVGVLSLGILALYATRV